MFCRRQRKENDTTPRRYVRHRLGNLDTGRCQSCQRFGPNVIPDDLGIALQYEISAHDLTHYAQADEPNDVVVRHGESPYSGGEINRFGLRIEPDTVDTFFPPDSTVLHAAEGSTDGYLFVGVDPYATRFDTLTDTPSLREV